MTNTIEAWIEEADRLRRRFEEAEPIDRRPVLSEYVGFRRVVNREADEKQRRQTIDIIRRNSLFREVASLISDRPDMASRAGVANYIDTEKPMHGWWRLVEYLTGDNPHIGTAEELDAGKAELLSADALGKLIAVVKQPPIELDETNEVVVCDGKRHGLSPDQFYFVQKLVEANGGIVEGRDAVKVDGSRADRIRKKLPDPIKRRVHSQPGAGGGYWIDLSPMVT